MRKARPERFRFALWDDPAGATPLALPPRRMRPAGLIVGVMFAIFAGILWVQVAKLHPQGLRSVFDLSFMLFEVFWIVGWSVGVLILGALTVLLLFYGESARLADGRLILVPQLGPLNGCGRHDAAHEEKRHTLSKHTLADWFHRRRLLDRRPGRSTISPWVTARQCRPNTMRARLEQHTSDMTARSFLANRRTWQVHNASERNPSVNHGEEVIRSAGLRPGAPSAPGSLAGLETGAPCSLPPCSKG